MLASFGALFEHQDELGSIWRRSRRMLRLSFCTFAVLLALAPPIAPAPPALTSRNIKFATATANTNKWKDAGHWV